ncbi:MAG: restriction endonuclease subunit S [Aquabacterium sp.]|uniref:restriction endonuclease subunit S n=1 Tax=Aquabacterium sp. TaxID=1872578 RepID=UPI003BECD3B7
MKYPRYPAYKPSRTSWLREIPQDWEEHRLKWSVIACENGIWGEEPDGSEDDIVCLRVADFDRTSFRVDTERLTIRSVEAKQRASRQIQKGDLLIEKSGGGDKQLVGCVVHFDHEFAAVCSNFVARMPVAEGQSSRFWAYAHAALYAGRLNEPAIKQTTGIQNLDAGEYLNNLLPYPSLPEQEQIAAFLDWKTAQIDALIVKKQDLIEKLKEKRLAVITHAVTKGLDPDAPLRPSGIAWLGDVPSHWLTPALKMRYSVELGKMLDEKRIKGQHLLPYLRNVDVQWDQINFDNLPEMDIMADELPRYTIQENDVLVCEGGEVGRSAVVGQVQDVVGYQKAVHRLRGDQLLEIPRFIYYTMLWAVNTGVFAVEGASTIAHLTADQLRRYHFPQPPMTEQRDIADWLDIEVAKVETLVKAAAAAIAHLTEYRTALITAAVTGQIDVRHITIPDPA